MKESVLLDVGKVNVDLLYILGVYSLPAMIVLLK